MKRLLFSIIIPTYNVAETIAACLDSLVCQSFPEFEIIIVDGGSDDNTMQTVNAYSSHFAGIRSVSEKDNGIYDAMNKGIAMAKGEWIYFLGSDDTMFNKDVLRFVADNINDADDIVYGNSNWVPQNNKESGEWGYRRLLNMSINHQRIFYRANLFKRLGSFNLFYKIASDYELNIRFFCDPAVSQKYIDHTIANYHSGGYSSDKIDDNFWNDWKSILLKNFSPHLPKKEIYKRLSWYCWHSMQEKKYGKAFGMFCTIYFNTMDFTFLKHSLSQLIKSVKHKNRNH
ncbi:MAG: glycosyltransferase family 2 protein [Ferruginibacter sp.]